MGGSFYLYAVIADTLAITDFTPVLILIIAEIVELYFSPL